MYAVYILKSLKGRYYIGTTNDIYRRLQQHNSGQSNSTAPYKPWEVVRTEKYLTLSEARKRERTLKSKKSVKILEIIIKGP